MARRLLLAVLLLLTACELIPQRLTDCSASRPCAGGAQCDPETSLCLPVVDLGTEPDAEVVPDLTEPECVESCMACQRHSDCPSQVCDDYLRSGNGGTCVPTAQVVYVDNRNGACTTSGSGDTPAAAMCTVAEALTRIDALRKRVIRIMPSPRDYGALTITGQTVSIFGPAGQGGSAQLQGGGIFNTLTVSGGARVVINGLELNRGRAGVLCQGGGITSVTLRHGSVTSCNDIGLLIADCSLELDRVLIAENANGALSISGSHSYLITNSYIVRNRSLALPAIKLASTGQGTFRFNTVVDNISQVEPGIECSGVGIVISDSIVFRNSRQGYSQLQNCLLRTTAVGRTDASSGIHEDPTFVPVNGVDYGLDVGVMNNTCCIDRSINSVRTDYFGSLRPRGKSYDIGAHEAR